MGISFRYLRACIPGNIFRTCRRWGTGRLPFKMWLYPLPAVLTMIGWAWLFWQTGATRKWGLAEIALGALAFLIRARKDRKSTRLNSSHLVISYAVFCLKKKNIAMILLASFLHRLIAVALS